MLPTKQSTLEEVTFTRVPRCARIMRRTQFRVCIFAKRSSSFCRASGNARNFMSRTSNEPVLQANNECPGVARWMHSFLSRYKVPRRKQTVTRSSTERKSIDTLVKHSSRFLGQREITGKQTFFQANCDRLLPTPPLRACFSFLFVCLFLLFFFLLFFLFFFFVFFFVSLPTVSYGKL